MKTFLEYLLEQDDPCWKGYRQLGTKKKNGKEVPNCIPIKEEKDTKEEANYQDKPKNGQYCEDCTMWREPNKCTAVEGVISPEGWCSYFEEKEEEEDELEEATYQGRDVPLNKPMMDPDGPKKRKVYVKNEKGNIVKVTFGQKGVKIKKDNPERRKSFRARHNCEEPGPTDKAKYWSCKMW